MRGGGEKMPEHLPIRYVRQTLLDDIARLEEFFFDLVAELFYVRRFLILGEVFGRHEACFCGSGDLCISV